MAKYSSKDIYSVLFSTTDKFSESNQSYLFENVFTESFIDNIKK